MQITPQEKEIIKTVVSQYQNQGPFAITNTDTILFEFYRIQLKLAGLSAVDYAAFFQELSKVEKSQKKCPSLLLASTDVANSVHSIVALNSKDGKSYETAAITSLPTAATNITQTLGLFDEAINLLGTVEYQKSYSGSANCVIDASGTYTGNEASKEITTIYTFSQTVGSQTVYGAEIVTTQSYPKDINNESPKDLNGNSEIKICLTRDASDCDYRNAYNGQLKIPIKGSIDYLGNIDLDASGKPINASNSIYIIREREGGNPITPPDGFNFFDQSTTIINGATLSWDLDWLTFKKPDFVSGEMVYYVFQVTLQVEGKSVVSYITNAPKSVLPDQRFLNTWTIKPMQIVYGCLGKDSMIRMAHGENKPIQDIVEGEWVQSQDSRILRVENTITGYENSYVKITLQEGEVIRDICASAGHPFCTTEGVLLAKELKNTTKLIGFEEEVAIKGLDVVESKIPVYNLHLSTDDAGKDLTKENRTMYANGVLVGDSVMQKIFEEEYQQKKENVVLNLPEHWVQDYLNYLRIKGLEA